MEALETILAAIVVLFLQSAIGGLTLRLGSKITRAEVTWLQAFLIALGGTLVALVPFVGWIASWIVMLWLLNKWCDCEPFPSGVLLILVSRLLQIVLGFSLRILLSSSAALLRYTGKEASITFCMRRRGKAAIYAHAHLQ